MNFNNSSCRLCLLESDTNAPIFSGYNERINLATKIMQIANVQVYEGDGLTNQICHVCINKVENFAQFKSLIEKSDHFLRQQMNSFQVDPLSASINKNPESVKAEEFSSLKKNVIFLQESEWNERTSLTHLENIVRPAQEFPLPESNSSLSFVPISRPVSNKAILENQELSDEEKPKPFLELLESNKVAAASLDKQNITEVTPMLDDICVRKEITSVVTEAEAEPSVSSTCNIHYFLSENSGLDLENTGVLGKMKELYSLVQDSETKSDNEDNSMHDSETNDESNILNKQSLLDSESHKESDDKINYCDQCDKSFDKLVSAKKHMLIHKKEKYTCSYCNKSFRQSWYLQSHIRTHTGERPFACSVCPKTFTDKGAMNAHIRVTHFTEKTHVCSYCNKAFKLKKQLERHERIHTGHQYHRCEICGKFYTQKSNLMKHLILHSGEKPFACPICEKRFAQKDNLNIHVLRHHSQQNPIVCDVCGKLFKNKMTLMGHKKSKHSENAKQIICEVCGKFFPDRSCLNSHMWVHNAGTPVQCDQCGKSYPHERAVRVHKRIVHTEVRKYCCDVCGMGFKTSQTLKHHKVVHTGERAFSCDECGRSFGQKTALKTHMRIHSGIEPYSCNRCGESFKWKQTCDKHVMKCIGKRFLPHGIPDTDLQNILQKRN